MGFNSGFKGLRPTLCVKFRSTFCSSMSHFHISSVHYIACQLPVTKLFSGPFHTMSLGTLTAVTHVKSVPCSNTSCSVPHTVSRRTQDTHRVSRRASERNFEYSKVFPTRIHNTQMQSVWTFWKIVYYNDK